MAPFATATTAPAKELPYLGRLTLYTVVLLLGLYAAFYPTFNSGFRTLQADAGDTILNHYFLEHTWLWLSQKDYPASYWSPRFFYPTPLTFTYSETLIGVAPFYWGFRCVFPEPLALQAWMILLAGLNYLSMLTVLRWLGAAPLLAVLGGFIFAFNPHRIDHLGHQQLLGHCFAPYAVYHFSRWLEQPNRRSWLLVLIFTAAQLLASVHLGWFLLLGLIVWFLISLLVEQGLYARCREFLRTSAGSIIVLLFLWAVGLWLYFRNYFAGNQGLRRSFSESLYFMTSFTGWFAAPTGTLWELRLVGGSYEQYPEQLLFPGFLTYTLYAIGILIGWRFASWRHSSHGLRAFTACLSAVTLMLLASHWFAGFSPWVVIYHTIPGSDALRVPNRINSTAYLLGLMGGLLTLQHVLQVSVPRANWRTAVMALLFVIGIGEQLCLSWRGTDRDAWYRETRELATICEGADVVFAPHDPEHEPVKCHHAIRIMWAGLWAKVPVINGYSGRWPPGYIYDEVDGYQIDEVVDRLGPTWQGRLRIIEWDKRWRSVDYDVTSAGDAAPRWKRAMVR